MPKPNPRSLDDEVIDRSLMRLNAVATAVGIGLLCGTVLLVTTMVLALRDGLFVGAHLGLLSQYFPGYSVSVFGSFVGFVYAFLAGAAAGFLLASITNRLTR